MDEPGILNAVIVYDGVDHARAFADGMWTNVPAAAVRVVEIIAAR